MPFFFVKAFHVHKEDLCISHDEQQSSHHDSADKCAICLFTLSSFTEAESFEYNCVQTENPVEYLIQKEKDLSLIHILIPNVHAFVSPRLKLRFNPRRVDHELSSPLPFT